MKSGKRATTSSTLRGYSTKKLVPVVEIVESRRLLAAGFGAIAGTAFLDNNHTNTLDTNDPYLPGATIQLFQVGNNTPIATEVTDAHGGYSFNGTWRRASISSPRRRRRISSSAAPRRSRRSSRPRSSRATRSR